jgi:nucleoside 2-deoxyribosyltransferase
MKKYNCYLASPLFSDTDNSQLDVIESVLDEVGLSYFSPRKDSNGVGDLRGAKTPEEKDKIAQAIYDLNVNAINDSDFLLVNTKGTYWDNAVYSDQGTLFELGYALAKDVPIVTFNFQDFPVNIMFSQVVVKHLSGLGNSTDELVESLKLMKDDLTSGTKTSKELRSKYFTLIQSELV